MEEITKEGLLALQACSVRNYTPNYVDDSADYYVSGHIANAGSSGKRLWLTSSLSVRKPEVEPRSLPSASVQSDPQSGLSAEHSVTTNEPKPIGNVTVIIGPMFAGKTSALGQNVKRHTIAGRTGVIVRYERDTRYDPLDASLAAVGPSILPDVSEYAFDDGGRGSTSGLRPLYDDMLTISDASGGLGVGARPGNLQLLRNQQSEAVNGRKAPGIITHAGHEFPGIPTLRASTLGSVLMEISKYDVIGVDEAQFFPDVVTITRTLANAGKIIVCAGLDANFKGEPFGQVCNLIANAEEVIKLKAVCMNMVPKKNVPARAVSCDVIYAICGADASFTSRLNNEQAEEIIGGFGAYIAVCRNCFCSRGWK
jgi:thymidine kinase